MSESQKLEMLIDFCCLRVRMKEQIINGEEITNKDINLLFRQTKQYIDLTMMTDMQCKKTKISSKIFKMFNNNKTTKNIFLPFLEQIVTEDNENYKYLIDGLETTINNRSRENILTLIEQNDAVDKYSNLCGGALALAYDWSKDTVSPQLLNAFCDRQEMLQYQRNIILNLSEQYQKKENQKVK